MEEIKEVVMTAKEFDKYVEDGVSELIKSLQNINARTSSNHNSSYDPEDFRDEFRSVFVKHMSNWCVVKP